MDGLEASICNEYISTLKGYLTDGLKYFAANTIAEHSNLVITEEEFDKCKLAIDTYKDLGKCEGKLEKLGQVHDWVEQYREIWNQRFENLDQYLEKLQTKNKKQDIKK